MPHLNEWVPVVPGALLPLSQRGKGLNLYIVNETTSVKTNAEVRRWYLDKVGHILDLNNRWLEQGLSAQERAEAAWRVRHDARLKARAMMADPAEVELLQQRDIAEYGNPNGPAFEFLVEKLREAGLEGDAVYDAIIDGSYRTDAGVSRKLGL